jgi:hypothetical protein
VSIDAISVAFLRFPHLAVYIGNEARERDFLRGFHKSASVGIPSALVCEYGRVLEIWI